MKGDDVLHFQGSYGKNIFLPAFKAAWIPNRVFDTYGRNLLAHLFDLIFFPLKSLFQMDFFHFYKIFNATLFVAFQLLIYHYLMSQIQARHDEDRVTRSVLPGLFVAFSILTILPWVNDVQLICYQIPAFISFVILAEIFKRMHSTPEQRHPTISGSWLVTMAFLAAFSLEAYSAILLGSVLLAWVMYWPRHTKRISSAPALVTSILLASFCLTALLIAALYSQRVADSAKLSIFKQILDFFFANGSLSRNAKIDCIIVMICFVGAIALTGFFVRQRKTQDMPPRHPGSTTTMLLTPWTRFLSSVLLSTIAVVALISLKADENYFSFTSYPWGGFLLIALFCIIPVLAIPIARLAKGNVVADSACTFIVALIISNAAIRTTEQSALHYVDSMRVLDAYRRAKSNSDGTFDTGLSLDAMPMQIRPLPTADSPQWFIDAYSSFFKKYYGADAQILFR